MSDAWPVFGYDPGHSGHGTGATRPRWPLAVDWRHNFDGRVARRAPVVDERGRAYVHVKMTQVKAPNFRAIGRDGVIRWALQTGHGNGPGAPPPTVSEKRVILPDTPEAWIVEARSGGRIYEQSLHPSGIDAVAATVVDGRIHMGFRSFALDAGEELWTYQREKPRHSVIGPDGAETIYSAGPMGHSPAVVGGTVYVAGWLREGETRFEKRESDESPECRKSSLVHFGTSGQYRDDYDEWGHVHALDAETGQLHWETTIETRVDGGTPCVVADDLVFVLDADARLYALNTDDGQVAWSRALPTESVAGSRPAVAENRVFIDGGTGQLLAIDGETGEISWRQTMAQQLAGPPAIVDGVVHVAGTDGLVAGLSMDGERRWEFDVGRTLRTGPIVAGGRLYVAGQSLVCLTGQA